MMTVKKPNYEFHQPGFLGNRLVRYWVDDNELTIEVEGKQPLRIPFQDLTIVHLSSNAHGRNESIMHIRNFRCRLTARQQVVEITNRSKRGIGHPYYYENQAFNSFIHELHERLLPFKEHVQFRFGNERYYVLALTAGLLAAILGPFMLASYGDHLVLGIATDLSVVTGLLVTAHRLQPGSYMPTNIPEKLLPDAKNHRSFID